MANLTEESKLSVIEFLKTEGNEHFKKEQYNDSLKFYQEALIFLDSLKKSRSNHAQSPSDDSKDTDNSSSVSITTSVILTNIATAHLRLNAANPDLFTHVLSALNCAQLALSFNPKNLKSMVRRATALYRLGLFAFADEITKERDELSDVPLLQKEKNKVETQSVKHHVTRFMQELSSHSGSHHKMSNPQPDVALDKNVLLRIAAAELIRQGKYKFADFMRSFFKDNAQCLQAVTTVALVLNWKPSKTVSQFKKYFVRYVEHKSITFKHRKQLIRDTLKMEGALWPTDQIWKRMLAQLIVDRHELEWYDLLNCADQAALNNIFDKHKHKIEKGATIEYKKRDKCNDEVAASSEDYRWIQSQIHELKQMRETDKQHIVRLSKALKHTQQQCDRLNEKVIDLQSKGDMEQQIEELRKTLFDFKMHCFIFIAVAAVTIILLKQFIPATF